MKRLSASTGLLILIAIAIMGGCAKDQEGVGNAATTRTPAGQQRRIATFVIPDGTVVVASLDTRLSTDENVTGDPFDATTTEPIIVDGKTAVPAGARIHGVLRDVQDSGRIKGRARMTLTYDTIADSQGKTHTISAQPLILQAASTTRGDVGKVAVGGAVGAVIGAIAGGGKGAAIGAGAGAGAGTILMLATKGDDLELNPGQKLSVHMTGSTSVQALAQR
jgi:outer membrane lipoprotein SlyB